jgi:hypothetical protein
MEGHLQRLADDDTGDLAGLRLERLKQEVRRLNAQATFAEAELSRIRSALHDHDACDAEWWSARQRVADALHPLASQVVAVAVTHGLPREAATTLRQQAGELIERVLLILAHRKTANDTIGSAC